MHGDSNIVHYFVRKSDSVIERIGDGPDSGDGMRYGVICNPESIFVSQDRNGDDVDPHDQNNAKMFFETLSYLKQCYFGGVKPQPEGRMPCTHGVRACLADVSRRNARGL